MDSNNDASTDLIWLKSIMKQELDLKPPSLARMRGKAIITRDENGSPTGHAALTNRWQGIEINTLVVDPAHRGKGISHQLLSKVDASRAFCYTRNKKLQSALVKAGYRRAFFPGVVSSVNLILSRTGIFLWMLLMLDFKRIIHQIKNLPNYKLYMKTKFD